MYYDYYTNELYHHGILGQKWGVRRYQNDDGSLTPAGRKRYGDYSTSKDYENRLNDLDRAMAFNKRDLKDSKKLKNDLDFKAIKRGNLRVDAHGNKTYRFRDSKGDQELKKKIDDMDALIKKYDKNIQDGKAETEVLLKNLKSKGFKYTSEEATRFTNRGKDYVKGAVSTMASVPVMTLIGNPFGVGAVVSVPLHREKGTRYNVSR